MTEIPDVFTTPGDGPEAAKAGGSFAGTGGCDIPDSVFSFSVQDSALPDRCARQNRSCDNRYEILYRSTDRAASIITPMQCGFVFNIAKKAAGCYPAPVKSR